MYSIIGEHQLVIEVRVTVVRLLILTQCHTRTVFSPAYSKIKTLVPIRKADLIMPATRHILS